MGNNTRIEADMTLMDVLMVMAEGNPGAITVLGQLLKRDDGPLIILSLDMRGVYGSDIWVAYKDENGEDISKFVEWVKHKS